MIAAIISSGLLCGIWHVSSDTISHYDLLVRLNDAFYTQAVIERDEDFGAIAASSRTASTERPVSVGPAGTR